jgi:hypothetical protein
MIQPAYVMALLIAAFLALGVINSQAASQCKTESCHYANHY